MKQYLADDIFELGVAIKGYPRTRLGDVEIAINPETIRSLTSIIEMPFGFKSSLLRAKPGNEQFLPISS